MIAEAASFIRANTAPIAPPLVPEIHLHLATEVVPLWHKTEEELEAEGVPPPYWAFAWAGGQALARYVLDHADLVRDKRVLDFGSGSGLVAIAAAMAGAEHVLAADIDPFAAKAIALNVEANFPPPFTGEVPLPASSRERRKGERSSRNLPSVLRRAAPHDTSSAIGGGKYQVDVATSDVIGQPCRWDVILVGDMCYERPLAERLLGWIARCAQERAVILLGDPGRSYFPKSGVTRLATYRVHTTRELEDRDIRETGVYRLAGSFAL